MGPTKKDKQTKGGKSQIWAGKLGKGDEVQEGDSLRSDVLVRQQAEVTGGEHATSEGTHERVGL
jgi:hypothetical protein